jgi:hypothetical protein
MASLQLSYLLDSCPGADRDLDVRGNQAPPIRMAIPHSE